MYTSVNSLEDNAEIEFLFSYASRTKNIRNTPIINENASYVLLQQYAEEIQRLRSIINSSNKHMRSLIINDDQHSLKTIYDHETSTSVK